MIVVSGVPTPMRNGVIVSTTPLAREEVTEPVTMLFAAGVAVEDEVLIRDFPRRRVWCLVEEGVRVDGSVNYSVFATYDAADDVVGGGTEVFVQVRLAPTAGTRAIVPRRVRTPNRSTALFFPSKIEENNQ